MVWPANDRRHNGRLDTCALRPPALLDGGGDQRPGKVIDALDGCERHALCALDQPFTNPPHCGLGVGMDAASGVSILDVRLLEEVGNQRPGVALQCWVGASFDGASYGGEGGFVGDGAGEEH